MVKIKEVLGDEVYTEINEIFELSDLEEEEFVIREVRRKIIEKIANIVTSLDRLLNPDSTYMQMYDVSSLDDNDREVIITIIKKFAIIIKTHKILEYKPDADKDKEFCITTLALYKENIDSVCKILDKLKLAYSNTIEKAQSINYLG